MAACTPPPAPLAATVRRAVAFVSQRVVPMQMPAVCMEPSAPAGSGISTVGYVGFPAADSAIFERPPSTWPPDRLLAVMHEVLHQIAMNNGLQAGLQLRVEEGLSEAIAFDLKPAWMKQMRGRDAAVGMAYRDKVSCVRLTSAQATGTRWTSPTARHWRFAVAATQPAARPPFPCIP